MPKSTDIELESEPMSSAFVSPISNGSPAVLYSSIAIKKTDESSCIPCAVVGIRQNQLNEFIRQIAQPGFIAGPSGATVQTSDTIPIIPPLPTP